MYPPIHFQEHNIERLQALVKQFPLATILMPCSQSDLNNICQVPVLYELSRNVFIAHVAKHNPLTQCDKQSVKLLFSGDNCYLSPSYSNNKTLPSWLYSSVQVTAKVDIIKSDIEKEKIMRQLTSYFEQGFTPMWSIDEVPKNHREAMYQQLSFITFTPIHWQGNFKLNQNKPVDVRAAIKNSLARENKGSIAALFN
ncbi:FMN-binding negative transcriptional regulator [Pseudoalteromonas fuliginea]|uniref:Transcriptional regulator n=1 Tax=Pseudoalteromonas fuliginea TaxID=1872678 RepID=A0ABD3Y3S6_9GAMM|nr:FMN-binding negative transcriptional regulator [Pseudoalteromonas fuliginea]KDC48138.1 transcriptional regulator [Pseudoalteromonas fuliginea]KJZ23198.1 transcriptional regulator [Pseudoalteromonas fuliginea]